MRIDWTVIISIVIALASFVWAIWQYCSTRKREYRMKEFENYHTLMKNLVEPGGDNKGMYVDRQTAIIYELRNFKRYYPITCRNLNGLKDDWKEDGHKRVMKEIDLTIAFLEKKKSNSIFCSID